MQEWSFSPRRPWLARGLTLFLVAGLLTAMAPWHSDVMPPLTRAGYFMACGLFWQAGLLAAQAGLRRWTGSLCGPRGLLAMVVVASVPGVVGIVLLNWLLFRQSGPLLRLWIETLPLAVAIAFAYRGALLSWRSPTEAPSLPVAAALPAPRLSGAPAFLQTHAPALAGRRLIALQAEDHYLRLHVEGGETLVLLRMRDAIATLGEEAGWQPHRSFWIACDARARAERRGQGWQMVLENGLVVPVSRASVPAMRAAGFGPAARCDQSSAAEASIIAVGSTAE